MSLRSCSDSAAQGNSEPELYKAHWSASNLVDTQLKNTGQEHVASRLTSAIQGTPEEMCSVRDFLNLTHFGP
jgi:hypothetical protein